MTVLQMWGNVEARVYRFEDSTSERASQDALLVRLTQEEELELLGTAQKAIVPTY